jgi:hypothetical protein
MDCMTAASVSVVGGVIELLGILLAAADLLYEGRVPNLRVTARRLLRRRPRVVQGSGQIQQGSVVLKSLAV